MIIGKVMYTCTACSCIRGWRNQGSCLKRTGYCICSCCGYLTTVFPLVSFGFGASIGSAYIVQIFVLDDAAGLKFILLDYFLLILVAGFFIEAFIKFMPFLKPEKGTFVYHILNTLNYLSLGILQLGMWYIARENFVDCPLKLTICCENDIKQSDYENSGSSAAADRTLEDDAVAENVNNPIQISPLQSPPSLNTLNIANSETVS